MPLLLIAVMTCFAIMMFVTFIALSQHSNLYSLRNLFLGVWLYYGFSAGIDLLLGVEIPHTNGELNLMDSANWHQAVFVMWCYTLCGLAFVTTYGVLQGKHDIRPIDIVYDLRTPPTWALALMHLFVANMFIDIFFGLDRMSRLAMGQQFASYKFMQLSIPLMLVIDSVIVLCGDRRKGIWAVLFGILLSSITGHRTYIMLMVLVALFRYRPSLRGWKLVGIFTGCVLMVFTFKTVYGVTMGWYWGDGIDLAMIVDNLRSSLCALDASASFSIAMFYTGSESPWWMGESYFKTTFLLMWPRMLSDVRVSTLAEDYTWMYHSSRAARGGSLAFSAIAEAWLNFSHVGVVMIGVFWGAIANFFDRRGRGIMFVIMTFMVLRIFRSDVASLVKTWVVVWGALFIFALALLTMYSAVVDARNPALRRRVGGQVSQSPKLGNELS